MILKERGSRLGGRGESQVKKPRMCVIEGQYFSGLYAPLLMRRTMDLGFLVLIGKVRGNMRMVAVWKK